MLVLNFLFSVLILIKMLVIFVVISFSYVIVDIQISAF